MNAKVPEAVVDRLRPGLQARIKVEAFPEEALTGVVHSVAPRPDPIYFLGSDAKVYSTLVEVEKVLPGLRPGMTAEVEILVTELDNVLSVPIPAVLVFDLKDHVAVKKPDGGFEWREVTLGMATDTLVEVKRGLKGGESIALKPLSLMSEEEKREKKFGEPTPTKPEARPLIQKQSGVGRGRAAESSPPR